MKITKTLYRKYHQSFFWDDEMLIGLCSKFITNLLSVDKAPLGHVKVTLSTTNPKAENFRKIERIKEDYVSFGGEDYQICYSEKQIINGSGIKIGDSFWMKAEIINISC